MLSSKPSTRYPEPPIISETGELPVVTTVKEYYNCFTESLCFQFTVIVVIVVFILNVIGWGALLVLLLAGAANRSMPDEETRKIWIEVASQVLNGMFFALIIGFLPWRLRDLVQLHWKRYRPRLLRRFQYSVSIVWIGIFVWAFIFNAGFQIAIAVCLWAIDRDDRPTWVMGMLVGFAIFFGLTGSLIEFILTQRTKKKSGPNKIQRSP